MARDNETETLHLRPDDITLEMRLNDDRIINRDLILQVAAYSLLYDKEETMTAPLLKERMHASINFVNSGLRFLETRGYIQHDPRRMTRYGIEGPFLYPTESLIEESERFVELQTEVRIRDIREKSGISRGQVLARGVGWLFDEVFRAGLPAEATTETEP